LLKEGKDNVDFIIGIFAILFGLFNIFYYIPKTTKSFEFTSQILTYIRYPNWFPNLISIGFIYLGIILALNNRTRWRRININKSNFTIYGRSYLTITVLLVYYFLVPYIGFLLCSIVLVSANLVIFTESNWKKIVIISFVSSLLIYLLFKNLLHVPFP